MTNKENNEMQSIPSKRLSKCKGLNGTMNLVCGKTEKSEEAEASS